MDEVPRTGRGLMAWLKCHGPVDEAQGPAATHCRGSVLTSGDLNEFQLTPNHLEGLMYLGGAGEVHIFVGDKVD